jgi:hypothetical protein
MQELEAQVSPSEAPLQACLTPLSSLILLKSDFGPHVVPHGLLNTIILLQLTGLTQLILVSL